MNVKPLPELYLEQVALGQISPTEIAQRFGLDETDISRRAATLTRSNIEILRLYPPHTAAAQIRARAARTRKVGPIRAIWLTAAVGAIAITAVMAIRLWPMIATDNPSVHPGLASHRNAVLLKGGPKLLLFRKIKHAVEPLAAEAQVRAGDVLQLGYVPGQASYGVLMSVDGARKVTLHFPSVPHASTALSSGTTLLPYSFVLDDAPEFERFIFVTSNTPLNPASLVQHAAKLTPVRSGPLPIPSHATTIELLLRK